jgi:hypothetical protein
MTSYTFQLASLELEFSNILKQYENEYANYISTLNNLSSVQNYNILPNSTFWGTNGISNNSSSSVNDCQALCSANPNCSGATFNSNTQSCYLRSGISNIQNSSSSESALMKETTTSLINLQNLNNKLTSLNSQIVSTINLIQPISNEEMNMNEEKKKILMQTFIHLTEERENINKILKEYYSYDQSISNDSIHVKQSNMHFNILLIFAVILIIFVAGILVKTIQNT